MKTKKLFSVVTLVATLFLIEIIITTCKIDYNKRPLLPSMPMPEDNATNVPLSPTLTWDCTDPDGDPLTYDIFFGPSSTPTSIVSSNQTEKSFIPATLTLSKNYYWKIDAKDNKGNTTEGTTWKFTTTSVGIETGIVTDIDNNVYKTVKIGNQWWMAENLKTTKNNDGSSIPLVTTNSTWESLTTPGYCWYDNDESYKKTNGALYNWYAANNGKLAPSGWHVATDEDWTILTTFLGGESVAGGKLKEAGTTHWWSPNSGATNERGFSALPGSFRYESGTFNSYGDRGYWWLATVYNTMDPWCRCLHYHYASVYRLSNFNMRCGFSVRCVRDNK